jgi:hypothetical protein
MPESGTGYYDKYDISLHKQDITFTRNVAVYQWHVKVRK